MDTIKLLIMEKYYNEYDEVYHSAALLWTEDFVTHTLSHKPGHFDSIHSSSIC